MKNKVINPPKENENIASVDFYFENFERSVNKVVVTAGTEYTLVSIIGNFCENKVFDWRIWGGTPTVAGTSTVKVKFNTPGLFTVELFLKTTHTGGGSVCHSDGSKRKVNYVHVI